LDFKNDFFFFPKKIRNPVQVEKGLFNLDCFAAEDFLKLQLQEQVVFAFAVEMAPWSSLKMVKMGDPISAAPSFHRG
jgi:hypothetical protein